MPKLFRSHCFKIQDYPASKALIVQRQAETEDVQMTISQTGSLRAFVTALLASVVLLAPLQANSEDITLKSKNGDFELTGELVAFENNTFTVTSSMGTFKIDGALFECVGDACPELGPIVWDVSLWGKRRAFTEHIEKLAELVAEKTDGQFTLRLSYGGLAPSRENLDGIAAGSFQMAQFCAGYHPDKNPSITVLELPFLGVTSMEQEMKVSRAVYDHPAVKEDMARWNATLLMPTPQPQYNIVGVGMPPTSFASFEGMTVRATGGTGAAIEALGASSITIPAPQVKDALSKGEINAVAFAPHAHMSFETVNSAIWWTTNLNPGTANCPVVVNTQALDALPTPSRVALLSSVDEALEYFISNYEGSTLAAWDAVLEERGIIQLTIDDEILRAINAEVAGPTANAWIAEKEALGLPARELYDLVTGVVRGTQ